MEEMKTTYELVRSDVSAASDGSPELGIRLLGRSADTVLPTLFHPAHSYTDLITQLQLTFFLEARYIAFAKTADQYLRVSTIAGAESGNVHFNWLQTFLTRKRKQCELRN